MLSSLMASLVKVVGQTLDSEADKGQEQGQSPKIDKVKDTMNGSAHGLPVVNPSTTPVSKWSLLETVNLRNLGTELRYVEPEVCNGIALARITKADVQSEIEYWSSVVYCHILGANPPYAVVNGYRRRIWKEIGIDKVLRVRNGLFLVRFLAQAGQQLVL